MENHELKTWMNSGRLCSSCSSCNTYRITLVKNPMNSRERRKYDGIVTAKNKMNCELMLTYDTPANRK